MALSSFIPQLWTARILANLHKNLVYGQAGVINRDYEGEIKAAGDSVRINNIGPVTILNYTRDQDLPAPEALTDDQRVLTIDQAKAFNFQVDDIDQAQAKPAVMDEAMREAAYALGDVQDQYIASLYTGVPAANLIGDDAAPVAVGPADAYDALVDLGVRLSEANVPKAGRFVVVPPWYYGLLLKDPRFVSGTAGQEVLQNGVIGRAAGFTVLESNNAPIGAQGQPEENTKIIAGHPMAWTVADQISKVEAYRPERRFADAVKGLHLYGARLVRPSALAVLSAQRQ